MRMPLLLVLLLTADSPDATPLDLPVSLQQLLDGAKWANTPSSFRIIALSRVAQGCAAQGLQFEPRRDAALKCIQQTFTRAVAPSRTVGATNSRDGLWLAHLNVILGSADQLGPCLDESLHRKISERLRALSLADPHGIAPSYLSQPDRWPADQAVVLASLKLFDQSHRGADFTTEPLRRFQRALEVSRDAGVLPASELTGRRATSALPRGCANSFLTRYLASVDPEYASMLWKTYRQSWWVEYGPVVGFREWPKGVTRAADVDSGPIIQGIGTAASALAIAAARAQGDEVSAARLEASASLAMQLAAGAEVRSHLADAIRFQAKWQPRVVH